MHEIKVVVRDGYTVCANATFATITTENAAEHLAGIEAAKGLVRILAPSGEASEVDFARQLPSLRRMMERHGADSLKAGLGNCVGIAGANTGLWPSDSWSMSTSFYGPSPSAWKYSETRPISEDQQRVMVDERRARYLAARSG